MDGFVKLLENKIYLDVLLIVLIGVSLTFIFCYIYSVYFSYPSLRAEMDLRIRRILSNIAGISCIKSSDITSFFTRSDSFKTTNESIGEIDDLCADENFNDAQYQHDHIRKTLSKSHVGSLKFVVPHETNTITL